MGKGDRGSWYFFYLSNQTVEHRNNLDDPLSSYFSGGLFDQD